MGRGRGLSGGRFFDAFIGGRAWVIFLRGLVDKWGFETSFYINCTSKQSLY